jgi:hypothetical protein
MSRTLLEALALPPDARVDQRVPKKLLLEQGMPTPADKRHVQEGVEELTWVAALKSTNVGVPAFRDDVREYLEIIVLAAVLRTAAKESRLVELIHRAVPYPVVLVAAHGETASLSLAHKRWSQGEKGKVVIDDVRGTAAFCPGLPTAEEAAFVASLGLAQQPARDLYTVYQGWFDRVAALEAARITGAFAPPESAGRSSAVRAGLDAHAQLQRDLAVLRAKAKKEKQINRRVELNLEIKRLEAQVVKATEMLQSTKDTNSTNT